MDVFIVSTGEWQSGQTHYIVAATHAEEAANVVEKETTSIIDWDSIRCVLHVLSTPVTEPMILETI